MFTLAAIAIVISIISVLSLVLLKDVTFDVAGCVL